MRFLILCCLSALPLYFRGLAYKFSVDELPAVSGKHLGFLLFPGGSPVVSTAGPPSVGGRGLHLPTPHGAGGSA